MVARRNIKPRVVVVVANRLKSEEIVRERTYISMALQYSESRVCLNVKRQTTRCLGMRLFSTEISLLKFDWRNVLGFIPNILGSADLLVFIGAHRRVLRDNRWLGGYIILCFVTGCMIVLVQALNHLVTDRHICHLHKGVCTSRLRHLAPLRWHYLFVYVFGPQP
jgi:hypothetical protein